MAAVAVPEGLAAKNRVEAQDSLQGSAKIGLRFCPKDR